MSSLTSRIQDTIVKTKALAKTPLPRKRFFKLSFLAFLPLVLISYHFIFNTILVYEPEIVVLNMTTAYMMLAAILFSFAATIYLVGLIIRRFVDIKPRTGKYAPILIFLFTFISQPIILAFIMLPMALTIGLGFGALSGAEDASYEMIALYVLTSFLLPSDRYFVYAINALIVLYIWALSARGAAPLASSDSDK